MIKTKARIFVNKKYWHGLVSCISYRLLCSFFPKGNFESVDRGETARNNRYGRCLGRDTKWIAGSHHFIIVQVCPSFPPSPKDWKIRRRGGEWAMAPPLMCNCGGACIHSCWKLLFSSSNTDAWVAHLTANRHNAQCRLSKNLFHLVLAT